MPGYFLNSEYLPLREVLLCKPAFKMAGIYNPKDVLHSKKINCAVIDEEFRGIIKLYKKSGIKVYLIDTPKVGRVDNRYMFNIMFARDLFFMTPKGAILSRMASMVRRQETLYAKRTLKRLGVPVRKIIDGNATFEGADALWINPELVLIGVGNRTNESGFEQVKEELKCDGIKCIRLPAPSGVIHLLGALQLIDSNLAVARVSLASPEIVRFLEKNSIGIIEVPENSEVRNKQAFNFVTLAPKNIVMPDSCPKTKKLFQSYGVRVAAQLPATQLINGNGGLACATGILRRAQ